MVLRLCKILSQPPAAERPTVDPTPSSDFVETVTMKVPIVPTVPELPVGSKIRDRYCIEKELGRGGMGVVYLARDKALSDRRVVIKVLRDKPGRDEWLRTKFAQECAALAKVSHPGIVSVFDTGGLPDGRPFIVMQYVDGVTLRREIHAPPMAFDRIAKILLQLGSALAAAHAQGICHRDIKPENIMVERLGSDEVIVRIIDFGLAALRNSGEEIAHTAVVAGSFPYMAPEQVMGRAGVASDIYSLAITAWEMIASSPPAEHRTPHDLRQVQSGRFEKGLRELRPEVPPSAEALVMQALSFDPNERPQNAKEFTIQLAHSLFPSGMSTAEAGALANPAEAGSVTVHVLSIEIAGYRRVAADEQRRLIGDLQNTVRRTAQFQLANAHGALITATSPGGMTLAFLEGPEPPVLCAMEIAGALQNPGGPAVRMGVHSGPAIAGRDINGNRSV